MNIRELFDDRSEIYASARPRYPARLYDWLAGLCPERTRVWDAACGNGQAAVDLAAYFDRVEATDVSASQIASAFPHERVRYSVQPSEETTFDPDSFDAVCVAQALHWFDHERFWPEARRVLKPGGLFVAWGYSWPQIEPAVDEVLGASLLRIIEPYWAEQNRLLWNGYRELSLPFEPLEPPQMDLVMHWTLDELFAYLHSWSATRRCMDDQGDGFFQRSHEQVRALWGDEVRRAVSMAFFVVAGRNAP